MKHNARVSFLMLQNLIVAWVGWMIALLKAQFSLLNNGF
jgi:hypothetical protein